MEILAGKKIFSKKFIRVHTSFVEVQILTALTFQIEAKHPVTNTGGFQLVDLIITEFKSHMTC